MGPVPGTGAPRAAGAGVAGSARQSGTSMPQLVPPMLAAPGSLLDSEVVTRAALDVLISQETGHLVDVRKDDPMTSVMSSSELDLP